MKKRMTFAAMILTVLIGMLALFPKPAAAATAPTSMWVAPSDTNNIPMQIDVWKAKTGGTNSSPTYTYQIYLPGNAVLTNCYLSWDGDGTVTIDGTTYTSGTCPIPAVNTETSYTFKSGNTTLATYKLITYQGSPTVQAVFINVDESEGNPTIAEMDGDPEHEVTCSGTIYIGGKWYEMTKMKGRGNYTWEKRSDKCPYNITLGTKIKFPGIDSEKTKKWTFLAEIFDHSLMCNRAGYHLAYQLGIGQDTASADVWMNGEYQGCYTVTPKTDSFVTKDGYMIEQDNYKEKAITEGGDPQFTLEGLKEDSGWSSCWNRITVKKIGDNLLADGCDPNLDPESPENMQRVADDIQAWLQDAWDAIRSDTGYNSKGVYYTEYIDIESFAKMYLMHEYVKSYDVCAGSILFHRDGTGEGDKLIAGPLWDLDNAMGSVYNNEKLGSQSDRRSGMGDFIINITEYKTSIYKTIGKHADFMEEVYRQYNYYKWAFEELDDYTTQMTADIQASAMMNHYKVNEITGMNVNNHKYSRETTLGRGTDYEQVYLATTNSKTDWPNYAANLLTYINARTLWFANNYTRTVSISGATLTVADQTYTGEALMPPVTVVAGTKTLVEGTDYTVSYTNNVNAGTATVTVSGIGRFNGTKTTTFVISPANIAGAVVSADDQIFMGEALTPAVTVTLGTKTLVEDTDYTVAYSDNTAVGTAGITVTGMGNYTGTATGSFTIAEPPKIDIATANVSVANQTYTGEALTPAVTVTLGDKTLVENTDFTVAYASNTNAGTATVTVTGIGGYTGTNGCTFEIAALDISDAAVSASAQTYTGSALTPAATVTLGGKALNAAYYTVAYSNNVNAGSATITVTGTGNYTGTATGSFAIAAASISDATVTAQDQTYTGSALMPAVTVKLGGKTLTAGSDYTVAYANNVNVGTATVTVTGTGNYTGTATGTFAIAEKPKIDISAAAVSAPDQTYTGSALTPAVTVTLNGTPLTLNVDFYVASYSNNVNAGTAWVKVVGMGGYTGEAWGSFAINPAHEPGWANENGTWYFYDDNGTMMTKHWESYNGTWYYFGEDGKLVQDGWAEYDGTWYYIRNYKVLKEGWVQYGSSYVYIKNYTVLKEGWVSYGGNWYYIRNYYPVVNDWVKYQNTWYHFNGSGVCDRTA